MNKVQGSSKKSLKRRSSRTWGWRPGYTYTVTQAKSKCPG